MSYRIEIKVSGITGAPVFYKAISCDEFKQATSFAKSAADLIEILKSEYLDSIELKKRFDAGRNSDLAPPVSSGN